VHTPFARLAFSQPALVRPWFDYIVLESFYPIPPSLRCAGFTHTPFFCFSLISANKKEHLPFGSGWLVLEQIIYLFSKNFLS